MWHAACEVTGGGDQVPVVSPLGNTSGGLYTGLMRGGIGFAFAAAASITAWVGCFAPCAGAGGGGEGGSGGGATTSIGGSEGRRRRWRR